MNFRYDQQPGRLAATRKAAYGQLPRLTIVTPYYRALTTIDQTARCVLNQTFPYWQWIIVNDGSDNAADLAKLGELETMDERVRVLTQSRSGPSAARNRAISQAETDIIVPLDADDLIEPTYLECIYWTLERHPEADWAYTDSVGFDQQEYVWKRSYNPKQMLRENLLTCTAGIRRQALLDVGGYGEEKAFQYEDWALWLRLMGQGRYPVHMNWVGFWYRKSAAGVLASTISDNENHREAMNIIRRHASQVSRFPAAIEFPRLQAPNFQKPQAWGGAFPPLQATIEVDKIRVLLLLPHMVMGGADLFNLDLMRGLDRSQYDISVLTTNPGDSTWRQMFEEITPEVFDLTTFLDIKDWAGFIHYFISTRRIDILFLSNSYYGYHLLPWLRKEFPDMAIVDYVHMEEMGWRAGGYARTSAAARDILEKTYVCNEHLRQLMIWEFGRRPEDVETVYIGVDTQSYDPATMPKGMARTRLGIDPDRPVVLFPCRIAEQKRPFLMLEIARQTRKSIPNVVFCVVGDGPQEAELLNRIRREGLESTIVLAGRQDDMRPWYADSQLTLICSIREGLALTAYESLAMGVPVISSDVGGQRELIDDEVGRLLPLIDRRPDHIDIETVTSYSPGEVGQYVSAICELLADHEARTQAGRKGRERILQGFGMQAMQKRFNHIFVDFKQGKGADQRRQVHGAISMLPHLAEDYATLYAEFEVIAVHSSRAIRVVGYMKELLGLRKSPPEIWRDFIRLAGNAVLSRYMERAKATLPGRALRKARMHFGKKGRS